MFDVYLAHPYGGHEENREDAGRIAEGMAALMADDYALINPLRLLAKYAGRIPEHALTMEAARMLRDCHLAVFCPGWEKSRGCRYEHYVAKRYGIPRIYLDEETCEAFRAAARANAVPTAMAQALKAAARGWRRAESA